MTVMSYLGAIGAAQREAMEADPRVIIMGEDNAGGEGSPGEMDAWGGVLGVTKGLYHKFPGRVLDTPIAEGAIVGAAIGMGVNGLRPVAEVQFADYIYPACDQIFSELARLRFRLGSRSGIEHHAGDTGEREELAHVRPVHRRGQPHGERERHERRQHVAGTGESPASGRGSGGVFGHDTDRHLVRCSRAGVAASSLSAAAPGSRHRAA